MTVAPKRNLCYWFWPGDGDGSQTAAEERGGGQAEVD